MATLRNKFFLEGIILGGLCGVVLGSLIAFQVGGERVNQARRVVDRVVRHQKPSVPYSVLGQ
jgi:uncharacterized integral membrane protein